MQLGWAAVGVFAGLVLYNNALALTRSTIVGRVIEGRLLRSA
jgi:hypothetical protein